MTVYAFVPDLMDRSRVAGIVVDLVTVGDLGQLAPLARHGDVVVVDLGRPGVVDSLPATVSSGARVIGFASHVDRALLGAARAAGCKEVLARSAFFSRLPELLGRGPAV